MPEGFLSSMITVAVAAAAVGAVISASTRTAPAQALTTPWGEPDLQGIWSDEFNQEFFTEAQRAELDKVRSDVLDSVPPLTPEAQKTAAADREFRLALLQSTDTCKKMLPGCAGGKYDPTSSPRRTETPPRYVTAGMNRNDGPEDSSLAERCLPISPLLANLLPEFAGATGSFRRIVQTPGGVSMFYEVGQGQGWQRNIVMNGSPHLPANIRQWFGDSRGHWEGNTLVIDVTNFSPKTDVFGSRENLHLVERWMRTGPKTLAYEVTIEDLTVWTRPWTVKQEFSKQSDEDNRIYYEPRCIEGNQGLPGVLHGRRVEDLAFAEGRGPDPASRDATEAAEVPDAEVPQNQLQQ
jgi:hypothetical protein